MFNEEREKESFQKYIAVLFLDRERMWCGFTCVFAFYV